VAAALAAAEGLDDPAMGILITGAEEFGLVGARVFVAQRADELRDAVVVNLDTIDQEGELAVVSHDARGAELARQESPRLTASGLAPRHRRLPVGILTDSLPFARAGVPAVTIGRLTWRTLRTIHTTRDTAAALSLETAVRVGQALTAN
jgi:Zn-dependent M28 family amino/carboxypeptidase